MKTTSGFIQLAHVGFHEGIDTFAHGILRVHRPYIAELCAGWGLDLELIQMVGVGGRRHDIMNKTVLRIIMAWTVVANYELGV